MGNNLMSPTWQRMLVDVLEQQRHWQEQIDRMLEPQRRMQEQLQRMVEPQQRLLAEIEKLTAPHRQVLEELDRLAAPRRAFQEQMERLLEPHRRIQEAFQCLQAPALEWQEQMRRLIEPQLQIAQQFQRLFESQQFGWVSEAQKQCEALTGRYLADLDPERIDVGPSGQIVLGDDTILPEEVSASLASLGEALAAASTPLDYLHRLTSFLARLHLPLARLVLLVVLPYVLSVAVVRGRLPAPMTDLQLRVAQNSGNIAVLELESPPSGKIHHSDEWTEEKNARRCELIDKEIEGTLTHEERIQLDDLQREMIEYRRRVAPVPIEGARKLHQKLLAKKQEKEGL